jgi:hypothetical protein
MMRREDQTESSSIVDFMVDPTSRSCDVDIVELHGLFRASTIVLTNELKGPPPPALIIQFAGVAALTGIKKALTKVR